MGILTDFCKKKEILETGLIISHHSASLQAIPAFISVKEEKPWCNV